MTIRRKVITLSSLIGSGVEDGQSAPGGTLPSVELAGGGVSGAAGPKKVRRSMTGATMPGM